MCRRPPARRRSASHRPGHRFDFAMSRLSKHFVVRPSAVWIATGVCLFVIGWWLCLFTAGYFGARKIADKFAAIRQFKQDLIPNHANTRIVFCQDTEHGVGIYFCDTAGGQPRLLCEKKENALQWRRFTMLEWSPDDSVFACALPDDKLDKESILIFDGAKGEPLAQVSVDQGLYQFAWLNNDSFAYSTHTDVRVVSKRGKNWEHKKYFEKVAANLENFVALSDHSLAWQDADKIWIFDFTSGTPPKKIWEATTNQLVGFAYAKSSDEFLLECSDENGRLFSRFSPSSKRSSDAGRIDNQQYDLVSNVKWNDGNPRYAYVSRLNSAEHWPDLCIQTKPNLAPIRVPWEGRGEKLTLNGDHLFFMGSENGKLPGIWEYDIKSERTRSVVFRTIPESANAKITAPLIGALTNALGNGKTYFLWPPANVSVGGKYPLIITTGFWNRLPYQQIAVNEGYYFAIVDETCVDVFCETLAKNPNVDTKRIYLYESSASTSFASESILEKPEMWKGVILFCPAGLPDATKLQGKKNLLIAGKDDEGAFSRLSKYQSQAAASGTPVTLCILPKAGHILESGASERIRAREFARFLSANR